MLLRKYLDKQVKDVLVSPEKPESGKQSSSPPILEEKDTMMPLSDVLKSLSEDPVGPRQAPISAQFGGAQALPVSSDDVRRQLDPTTYIRVLSAAERRGTPVSNNFGREERYPCFK